MSDRCQTIIPSLSAYVDGELPPHEAAAVAEHLATCFPCSAEYETMLETVAAVRGQLERFTAPDVLRARIRTTIASTPSGDAAEGGATSLAPPRRRGLPWTRLGSWAATIVVAAALGSGATIVATRGHDGADSSIASQVLASHVRSLMPDHLTDVRSNDQHNVKPWFNGRLDFSPTVPRLEDQGFPLVGGRVDELEESLRSRYETSIVPGRFFEMPEYFRIGIGGETEMLEEGLGRIGRALDELK